MASFKLQDNGFIYLIHWVERKKAFRVSTKMKITKGEWNQAKGRPNKEDAMYNNRKIVSEQLRYEVAFNKALSVHPELTIESIPTFREIFQAILTPTLEAPKVKNELLPYYELHLKRLKDRQQSNFKSYNTCYKYLCEYYSGKNPTFEDVDMKFYQGFTDFLFKKNLAMNTVANQFKLVKAVMQSAFMEGLHTNEAFRHFKKRMEKADNIYLSEEELTSMYKLKLTGHLEKARDYFIVGAFTGLRFDDWDRVSTDKVVDGILTMRSAKTGEVSTIPIHPYVGAILKKHDGTLPKKSSNVKLNEYIKVVAMRAGISNTIEIRRTKGNRQEITIHEKWELVTTHTARRSLATNLILQGVSPYIVMRVTGHRSFSSFEKYVKLQELEAGIELKSLSFFN